MHCRHKIVDVKSETGRLILIDPALARKYPLRYKPTDKIWAKVKRACAVTMTKRELVIRVANRLGMTQSDVSKVIEGTFEAISQSLAEGKRWELRDFGVFEPRESAPRTAQNPKTLERIHVPGKKVVKFKAGQLMKQKLNSQNG